MSGTNARLETRADDVTVCGYVQTVLHSTPCSVFRDEIILAHAVAVTIHACALVRMVRDSRRQVVPNDLGVRARRVVCTGTAVAFVDVNIAVPTVAADRAICPDELNVAISVRSIAYHANLRVDPRRIFQAHCRAQVNPSSPGLGGPGSWQCVGALPRPIGKRARNLTSNVRCDGPAFRIRPQ